MICNNGDYESKNEIVFCDLCGICVHQDCYGISIVPNQEWKCYQCEAFGVD